VVKIGWTHIQHQMLLRITCVPFGGRGRRGEQTDLFVVMHWECRQRREIKVSTRASNGKREERRGVPRGCGTARWYGVATSSRLLQIIGLFCRLSSRLKGSFAKEACNLKEPTDRSHPVGLTRVGGDCTVIGERDDDDPFRLQVVERQCARNRKGMYMCKVQVPRGSSKPHRQATPTQTPSPRRQPPGNPRIRSERIQRTWKMSEW